MLPNHRTCRYLERHVPLHERMAFYSLADVAVLTATRDGFNLVPYEYIMCRWVPTEPISKWEKIVACCGDCSIFPNCFSEACDPLRMNSASRNNAMPPLDLESKFTQQRSDYISIHYL